MGFSTLNLNQNLIKAITQQGYQEPTPIQLEAIPAILNQQDVMAGAQTGTGKTAAFALPILHQLASAPERQGKLRALVLTPTRELAQQVAKSFESYGQYCDLTMTIAYGGISIKNQVDALKAGVDILVATPGRLLDHLVKGTISLDDIEHLVFDEADRMLDMGFIIDIKRILKRMPEQRQTMLFSATFDDAIFNLSKTLLNDPILIEVNDRNTAASQVQQTIYCVDSDRKRELTSYLIGSRNWQQVLIFTRTKQGCDALAKEMCKDGIKTQSIHGDKSQGARERALSEFKEGKIRALVATDVAARGIDIDQLQYVINYELPYIAEDYIHRIGRTGRAGSSGIAISLLSSEENYLLEAVESVLDTRIAQEWIPGFEPDLNKVFDNKNNSNSAQKKRANDRAFGGNNKSRRRR
ncbi:MAG: DEAD/DEAH box helicase [Gammaproteobacteria bacterium]|nr:DEAD/DEAH box helicase [Gammaproteobacteria bacterium]